MRTRYGVSPWIHELPVSRRPAFPRFRGNRTADVVIVGGGLTGCAVAQACAAAGLKTVLLEAERIGQAGTGHAGGLLTPEPGPAFRDVAAAHGLRGARRVFDAWRRGALDGAALLRRLGITCDLEARDMLILAGRDDDRLLRKELEARRAAGLDVAWLAPRQVQAATNLEARGAMKVKGGFTLDPLRACIGLAGAAAKRRAELYERSAVKTVKFTRKQADVIAEGGTIRTGAVVVATGSAAPVFRSLQRHFKRREMSFVMTHAMPAALRKQLSRPDIVLRDTSVPAHRIRWAGNRLILAGDDRDESAPRLRDATVIRSSGELMYELLTMYPAIFGLQPEYGWQAPYGEPVDGLMYIGAHRNFPHHVFALGGPRDSVTGAFVASRIVLRAILGDRDKADEVFGWNR